MIEKVSMVAAALALTMAVTPTVTLQFANGCSVTHLNGGVYAITLDQPLVPSECVPTVTALTAAGTACSATITPNAAGTVWTVTTSATNGGAGADIAGSLTVMFHAIGQAGLSL